MKAVHLFIDGRVQGVGFRAFTRRKAQQLQLNGWVRNLNTGQVEVKVAGPPEKLNRLQEHLQQGPPLARVDDITSQPLPEEETKSLPQPFIIKPTKSTRIYPD